MRTVIIGGGVIGLTTAYHLAREGVDITLVDARETGLGAAAVNAGWVVPADSQPLPGPGAVANAIKWMTRPDSPLYIKPSLKPSFISFMLGMFRASNAKAQEAGLWADLRLAENSVECFDEYKADGIDYELHHEGMLMAFKDAELMHHLTSFSEITKQFGLEPTVLRGDDVQAHEPMLNDSVKGGLFYPKELHLVPGALMRSLHAKLVSMGAEIIENAPIDAVQIANGRVVSVSSGSRVIEGDKFFLTAGAWTGQLSKLFGANLPIRPGKGYSIEVAPYPLRSATNLYDAKVALTPFKDRFRLAGTMEFGGLDENVNKVRVEAILKAPASWLRDFETPKLEDVTPRAGMRPMSPDGLAVMGRLPRLSNAYVATAHGMMGVTLAPGTARVMTELIANDVESPILKPFSPARFRGGR